MVKTPVHGCTFATMKQSSVNKCKFFYQNDDFAKIFVIYRQYKKGSVGPQLFDGKAYDKTNCING